MDTQPKMSALIVEDDAAIQRLVAALLRREGVQTEIVGDGDLALDRLRDNDYDAILLDLMLPRTNGFEVIGTIKEAWPHLLSRVIVMTAASEQALRYFESTDVRKIVRKPFDVDALVAEVLACGSDQQRRRSAMGLESH